MELRSGITWKEDVEHALEQLLGTVTIPMQAAAPVDENVLLTSVDLQPENGHIASLTLESGQSIAGDLFECLQQAGNDTEAQQQCQDQFQRNIEDQFSVTLTPSR